MNPVFSKAIEIIHILEANGYQAFFVGGAIRDLLIGKPIGDIDIATSASPQQVMTLFPKTIPVGIQHGTVIVLMEGEQYEVTTFRKDEDYIDYRRPTHVTFVNSLNEDLKRRDFTINAIAMDRNGTLLDPFNGQAAIRHKVIETVGPPGERFKEDALRMMRAIRFHSQLSFDIEYETKQAIRLYAELLKHISIERITTELEKILRGSSSQSAIHLLVETELYKSMLNLSEYEDRLIKWPKLSYTKLITRSEIWALFCYLLKVGKVDSFLKQWKLPTKIIKDAAMIVEGLFHLQSYAWSPYFMYKNGKDYTLSIERCYSILNCLSVEERVNQRLHEFLSLPLTSRSDLSITGNELMKWGNNQPGPWIAEALTAVEEAILSGELENNQDEIKEWLVQCNRL